MIHGNTFVKEIIMKQKVDNLGHNTLELFHSSRIKSEEDTQCNNIKKGNSKGMIWGDTLKHAFCW